jgi:hypothetical protein
VRLKAAAPLGELGEHQRLLARGEDLVDELVEPIELARPAGQPRTVGQQVRRVVADLLEPQHRLQHQPAPFDALGCLDLGEHVLDDRAVEARLLAGEVAALVELDLVGQVGRDRGVGLLASQHERPGEPPQPGSRLVVVEPLDRDGEALAERGLGTEQAGVAEVHDRPQLG